VETARAVRHQQAERPDAYSSQLHADELVADGVSEDEGREAIAAAGWTKGDGYGAGAHGGSQRPDAGGTDKVVVRSHGDGKIHCLVDAEDDGLRDAGLTDVRVGEVQVGAQLAHYIILRVGEIDVAARVGGDAQGLVERNGCAGLTVLRGIIGAGKAAGQAGNQGQCVGPEVITDQVVLG
jgi:hypothetical protein